jgi:hypothetical protein
MSKYEVSVLLECGHINSIYIEAAPFVPQVGSLIICNICKRETKIKKRSEAAYMGPTAPHPTIERQREYFKKNKNRE